MTSIKERTEIARESKRNVPEILKEIEALATMSRNTALSCFYVVFDSQGKPFMGISVRLAELIASCWGNIHTGAKIIKKTPSEVIVQGFVHDFEKNTIITVEVQRSIHKLTAEQSIHATNAASSIAFRNAIFKAIPAALNSQIIKTIKEFVIENANQDDREVYGLKSYFESKKVGEKEITKVLDGIADAEQTFMLIGIRNAIEEGDTTIAEVFGVGEVAKPKRSSKYNFGQEDQQEEPLDVLTANEELLEGHTKKRLKKDISLLEVSSPTQEEIHNGTQPPEKEPKTKKKRGRGRPRKIEK